jgi:hypothetical protein
MYNYFVPREDDEVVFFLFPGKNIKDRDVGCVFKIQ